MRVRLTILCGFVAVGCAWLGCAQPAVTRPQQQAGSVVSPSNEAVAEKPESNIVLASFESSVDVSAGPRVSLRLRSIDFNVDPTVKAILDELWGPMAASQSADKAKPLARCRVATKEICASLTSFEASGLTRTYADTSKIIPSGKATQWNDGTQWNNSKWTVTPTAQSPDLIHISVAGELWQSSSETEKSLVWAATIVNELRVGETLIVEGHETNGLSTEITRVPVLGDIPIVGPLMFAKKTLVKETFKTLYLITAEIAPETDSNVDPK